MKEKILNWIESENTNLETNVLALDGEFGIGKTTYVKEVFDWNKTNKKVIYINLLNLDLDDKFINNLIKIFNECGWSNKVIINKIKEKTLEVGKQFKNTIKNKLWLTIDAFDDLKIIENKSKNFEKRNKYLFNDTVLILDDIERINPQNILKALGLINQLRYKYKKMKILIPCNSKILNKILNNFLGLKNEENEKNYLQKYLGNWIDFKINYYEMKNYIMKNYIKRIYLDSLKSTKNYATLIKKIKINWRDLILLKKHFEILELDYLFVGLIKNDSLILFNKEKFEKNILFKKNEIYLVLNKNESFFDEEQSFLRRKQRNELIIECSNEIKNIIKDKEIGTILKIEKEIYDYFKKYHNS